jgi:hypothetical protein
MRGDENAFEHVYGHGLPKASAGLHHPASEEHPSLEDYPHAGRVRIVVPGEADEAAAGLRLLFPHDPVLTAPMGCGHVCLYTATVPASVVSECISEHLEEVEHRPARLLERGLP